MPIIIIAVAAFLLVIVLFMGKNNGRRVYSIVVTMLAIAFGLFAVARVSFPINIPTIVFAAIALRMLLKVGNKEERKSVSKGNNTDDIIDVQATEVVDNVIGKKRKELFLLADGIKDKQIKSGVGEITKTVDSLIILFKEKEELSEKYEKIVGLYCDYLINSLVSYKSIESTEHAAYQKDYFVKLNTNLNELLKDIKSVLNNIVLMVNENRANTTNAELDAIRQDMRMRGLIE